MVTGAVAIALAAVALLVSVYTFVVRNRPFLWVEDIGCVDDTEKFRMGFDVTIINGGLVPARDVGMCIQVHESHGTWDAVAYRPGALLPRQSATYPLDHFDAHKGDSTEMAFARDFVSDGKELAVVVTIRYKPPWPWPREYRTQQPLTLGAMSWRPTESEEAEAT